jgi:serine phosphatase RsbU (regulator of sigma subunit)
VARLGQLGLQGVPLDDLLDEAMAVVADALDVEHVALFEVTADRAQVQGRAAFDRGKGVDRHLIARLRLGMGSESMPGYTATVGGCVVAPDLLGDERFRARAPEMGVPARAAIAAPITWGASAWGVLAAYADVIRPWDDEEISFVQAVGTVVGLAICRDQTEGDLRTARADAERARERLALLAESGVRLTASLEPAVVFDELADFCVPRLADLCIVGSVDEGAAVHQVALRASSPELVKQALLVRRLRREGSPGAMRGEQFAVQARRSVAFVDLSDADLEARSTDAAHLDALRGIGARSAAIVPLIARERVVGVLTLVSVQEHVRYDADTVALVEELATRAALAVDNARLFDSRHRIITSLQSVLLPPALPEIAGLAVAARYRVGEADIEIGGDFYDVIEVADGVWGIVVGDVCGRGPDAAALTGLVRHSVRTAVVRERWPSRVLGQTNAALLGQIDDGQFCTAAYLRVQVKADRGVVHVTASSAGHPRPLVVRADGSVEVVDCGGLLLGVAVDPSLRDEELELGPGDAIVLYTDGVTEARSGHEQFGEERLLAAVKALAGRSATEIAAGIDDAVGRFQDGADDDVAIVVVRNEHPAAR